MSKLDDYNAFVINEHSRGNYVKPIREMLTEFIIQRQRVTADEARRHVYRNIGHIYQCHEFDSSINKLLSASISNGDCILINGYYVSTELYNKYKDIFENNKE